MDHHIQRTIIHKLAFVSEASFSELKPSDIDNKLFTYHLKKTILEGYVQKSAKGLYSLTPEGRRLSTGVKEKQRALVTERPLSALFLIIRRKEDSAWLLYKRKTHPMLGFHGFMHLRPNASESISETAAKQVQEKTGLQGTFTALGGGYVRVFEGDTLESFTHFTLLYCNDIQGELIQNDEHVEFFWCTNPHWQDPSFFPTTQILKEKYEAGQPFFIEETYQI
jgi:ADP-ribose pyrophosphatase YjhB (NUDIX family)